MLTCALSETFQRDVGKKTKVRLGDMMVQQRRSESARAAWARDRLRRMLGQGLRLGQGWGKG